MLPKLSFYEFPQARQLLANTALALSESLGGDGGNLLLLRNNGLAMEGTSPGPLSSTRIRFSIWDSSIAFRFPMSSISPQTAADRFAISFSTRSKT